MSSTAETRNFAGNSTVRTYKAHMNKNRGGPKPHRVRFEVPKKRSRLISSPAGLAAEGSLLSSSTPTVAASSFSCSSYLLILLVIACCLGVSILLPYAVLCTPSAPSALSSAAHPFCATILPMIGSLSSMIDRAETGWNALVLRLEMGAADATPIQRLGLLPPSVASLQAHAAGAPLSLYSVASVSAKEGVNGHNHLQHLLMAAPGSWAEVLAMSTRPRVRFSTRGIFPYSSGNSAWCAPHANTTVKLDDLCSTNFASGDLALPRQWPPELPCAMPLTASLALGGSTYDEACQRTQELPEFINVEVASPGDAQVQGPAAATAQSTLIPGTFKCIARSLRSELLSPLQTVAATDLNHEAAWVAQDIAPLPVLQGSVDPDELRLLQQSAGTRHHLWAAHGSSFTPLHYDMEYNVYTQVKGSKLWLLLPPSAWRVAGGFPSPHHRWRQAAASWAEQPELLHSCQVKSNDGLLPVCLTQTNGTVQLHCQACRAEVDHAWPGFLTVLQAGSTLVLPPMWFHSVLSSSDGGGLSVAVNSWTAEGRLQEVQATLQAQAPPLMLPPHSDVPGVATILRSYVWSTLQALLVPVQQTAKRYLRQRRKWATHNAAVGAPEQGVAHTAKHVWTDVKRLADLTPHCLVGWWWLTRWHVVRQCVWSESHSKKACKSTAIPRLTSCEDVFAYLRRVAADKTYLPVGGTPWRHVLGSNAAQATLAALKQGKGGSELSTAFIRSVQTSGMALLSLLPADVRERDGTAGERRSSFLSTGQATHLSANAATLVRGWATIEMLFADHVEELIAGSTSMLLPLTPAQFARGYPGTDLRGGADWLTASQAKEVEMTQGMPLRRIKQPTAQCGASLAEDAPRPPGAAEAAQMFWHVLVVPQLPNS